MRRQTNPERTGEKQDRGAGGRFLPGRSGNPAGRPAGRRNRGVELFDEVIDEDEFRKIVQKAADLATDGNRCSSRSYVSRSRRRRRPLSTSTFPSSRRRTDAWCDRRPPSARQKPRGCWGVSA
jgi:hypothetical protein